MLKVLFSSFTEENNLIEKEYFENIEYPHFKKVPDSKLFRYAREE